MYLNNYYKNIYRAEVRGWARLFFTTCHNSEHFCSVIIINQIRAHQKHQITEISLNRQQDGNNYCVLCTETTYKQ